MVASPEVIAEEITEQDARRDRGTEAAVEENGGKEMERGVLGL